MKAVFRADASLQMGSGHVMRCLTLADALRERGARCLFLCRAHPGHLIEFIRSKGHEVRVLSCAENLPMAADPSTTPAHAAWLGATQAQDAAACIEALRDERVDWLVVDHYALDARWECALRPHCGQLMVIDDLADRPHDCDLLLDQTFGRDPQDYRTWVPGGCPLLCGSRHALLRPEFAALREHSLRRREVPQLQQLLVTLGGVDKDNTTGAVLESLQASELPLECRIIIVMGPRAPWVDEVRRQAQGMRWPTTVLAGVGHMAQLMADSDLAIGAAGSTTWERCCLGLPTIQIVLADNQRKAAALLEQAQAVLALNERAGLTKEIVRAVRTLVREPQRLADLSHHARQITDGTGCTLLTERLLQIPLTA